MTAAPTLHIDARDLYFVLEGQRLHDGALLEVWWQGAWHRGLFSWCELSPDPPRVVGWGGPPHEIGLDTPCRSVPDPWQRHAVRPAA